MGGQSLFEKRIGILLFDGVEELDAVGPWEVLSYWTKNFPHDGFRTLTFSKRSGRIHCAKGLVIESEFSYGDAPTLDVMIYPGGRGTRDHLEDAAQLDWLRSKRAEVPLLASVCTGSLVFAAAGLLTDRPATTHFASLSLLQELDPTIQLRPNDRFVDDGDIVTSAGVSAGIDMALHLVSRLAGADRSREVRQGIQYDPDPPV